MNMGGGLAIANISVERGLLTFHLAANISSENGTGK